MVKRHRPSGTNAPVILRNGPLHISQSLTIWETKLTKVAPKSKTRLYCKSQMRRSSKVGRGSRDELNDFLVQRWRPSLFSQSKIHPSNRRWQASKKGESAVGLEPRFRAQNAYSRIRMQRIKAHTSKGAVQPRSRGRIRSTGYDQEKAQAVRAGCFKINSEQGVPNAYFNTRFGVSSSKRCTQAERGAGRLPNILGTHVRRGGASKNGRSHEYGVIHALGRHFQHNCETSLFAVKYFHYNILGGSYVSTMTNVV